MRPEKEGEHGHGPGAGRWAHRRHPFHHHHHHRHGHGWLFWRVYGHGLLLLVLVALAVGIASWTFHRDSWWREPDQLAGYGAERIADLRSDPARLQEELRRMKEVFGIEATVWAADGALLASSAQPPLSAPPRTSRGPVRMEGRGLGYAVPLPDGGGRVLFARPPGDHHPERAFLALGVVLVMIALGSVPLARSIAAPVERLTRAARALGGGDLTARAHVRARGEVGELGRAFDEMAERLERLVRSERELLANVSHELRTPLARIRVALELAAEGDLERARRFLGEIGTDLEELDRLVEDVLSTARLDLGAAGGLPLQRAPVEPGAVVEAAAARFRTRWPERILEVEAPAGLPSLDGDAALLRRLLANLLDNAAKYSEAPSPVRLVARAEESGLVLEVRDQGIGIAAEDLPRLFTPFFRTDRSRVRGTGGVGLGLALARRIAEAHGGEIQVESAPGQGTVFRVRLPL